MIYRVIPYSVVLIAVSGFLLILSITRWGPGVGPDALNYLDGAKYLIQGQGYYAADPAGGAPQPITHWPPGFSLMLAGVGKFGVEPLAGARWLNAVFFAATIALIGLLVWKLTDGAKGPTVFAAAMVLTSPNMIVAHCNALSEPAFLTLCFLTLYLITRYLQEHSSKVFIAAAGLAGVTLLTRYIGVALIGTCALSLLLFDRGMLRDKLLRAVGFAAVAFLAVAGFVIRNKYLTGGASDMHVQFHPVSWGHLVEGLQTVAAWFAPEAVPWGLRLGFIITIAVLVVVALAFLKKQSHASGGENAQSLLHWKVLSLFVPVFVVSLGFFITFFDISIPFDSRLLLPIQLIVVILLTSLGYQVYRAGKVGFNWRPILVGIGVLFIASYTVRGGAIASKIYRNGLGYTGRTWVESEILQIVRRLPPNSRIYCNVPSVVFHLTGRFASGVPDIGNFRAGGVNPDYDAQIAILKRALSEPDSVLVYLKRFESRSFQPTEADLVQHLSLLKVETGKDGSVYKLAGSRD